VTRRPPSPPSGGQVCILFAADIAGFTTLNRDDDIRLYLHEELYKVLEKAFDAAGIPWYACFREDRGDGVLIIMPPGTPSKAVIDPLPERLRSLIRRHNNYSRDNAGIQLRTAAHIGPVDHDGNGFIGTDINFLFRMLEARPLKRQLAGSGAELALIASDYVYRNVVCRYPSLAGPDTFQPVRFQVRYTRARAWTYIPGIPAGLTRLSPDQRRCPGGTPPGQPAGARHPASAPACLPGGRQHCRMIRV
jgi:hypothetical protein